MAMRIRIEDAVVYEGPAVAVPSRGDRVRHDGKDVPVEATTWEFAGDQVTVTLVVGEERYTF